MSVTMSTKVHFESRIDRLATDYAADHSISKAAAYDAVLQTAEGRELYAKSVSAPAGQPVAKAISELSPAQKAIIDHDVHLEVTAKQVFPDDCASVAITKFLATPDGQEMYGEYLTMKAEFGAQ